MLKLFWKLLQIRCICYLIKKMEKNRRVFRVPFPSISALPGPCVLGGNGPYWTTDSEFWSPAILKTRLTGQRPWSCPWKSVLTISSKCDFSDEKLGVRSWFCREECHEGSLLQLQHVLQLAFLRIYSFCVPFFSYRSFLVHHPDESGQLHITLRLHIIRWELVSARFGKNKYFVTDFCTYWFKTLLTGLVARKSSNGP